MAARKKKIVFWGAAKSRTTGAWKSVVFTSDGKYYLNTAFKGLSKQEHEDVAGIHASRMRSTSKFKNHTFKKVG